MPRHILLVDDYADAADMYAEYLIFNGYTVTVARSGQEAVDLAHTERPALILMDLEMSGMSGTQAMHLIRTDDALGDTPIVALTAHVFASERDEALREGFDEFIPKPCLPDVLLATVERLLTTERQT